MNVLWISYTSRTFFHLRCECAFFRYQKLTHFNHFLRLPFFLFITCPFEMRAVANHTAAEERLEQPALAPDLERALRPLLWKFLSSNCKAPCTAGVCPRSRAGPTTAPLEVSLQQLQAALHSWRLPPFASGRY